MADLPVADRRRGLAYGISAGIAAGVIFALLIVSMWTLLDVSKTQANHAATLQHIQTLSMETHHLAKSLDLEVAGLRAGNKTVGQILHEAGQVSAQLEASQHAICVKLGITC
jgi:hypothetical protein